MTEGAEEPAARVLRPHQAQVLAAGNPDIDAAPVAESELRQPTVYATVRRLSSRDPTPASDTESEPTSRFTLAAIPTNEVSAG